MDEILFHFFHLNWQKIAFSIKKQKKRKKVGKISKQNFSKSICNHTKRIFDENVDFKNYFIWRGRWQAFLVDTVTLAGMERHSQCTQCLLRGQRQALLVLDDFVADKPQLQTHVPRLRTSSAIFFQFVIFCWKIK